MGKYKVFPIGSQKKKMKFIPFNLFRNTLTIFSIHNDLHHFQVRRIYLYSTKEIKKKALFSKRFSFLFPNAYQASRVSMTGFPRRLYFPVLAFSTLAACCSATSMKV